MDFAAAFSKVVRYSRDYSHTDFHRKINENLQDLTPALAYSDWLEENDKPAQAQVVREHVAEHGEAAYPPLTHEWATEPGDELAYFVYGHGPDSYFLSIDGKHSGRHLAWVSNYKKRTEAATLAEQLQKEGAVFQGDHSREQIMNGPTNKSRD